METNISTSNPQLHKKCSLPSIHIQDASDETPVLSSDWESGSPNIASTGSNSKLSSSYSTESNLQAVSQRTSNSIYDVKEHVYAGEVGKQSDNNILDVVKESKKEDPLKERGQSEIESDELTGRKEVGSGKTGSDDLYVILDSDMEESQDSDHQNRFDEDMLVEVKSKDDNTACAEIDINSDSEDLEDFEVVLASDSESEQESEEEKQTDDQLRETETMVGIQQVEKLKDDHQENSGEGAKNVELKETSGENYEKLGETDKENKDSEEKSGEINKEKREYEESQEEEIRFVFNYDELPTESDTDDDETDNNEEEMCDVSPDLRLNFRLHKTHELNKNDEHVVDPYLRTTGNVYACLKGSNNFDVNTNHQVKKHKGTAEVIENSAAMDEEVSYNETVSAAAETASKTLSVASDEQQAPPAEEVLSPNDTPGPNVLRIDTYKHNTLSITELLQAAVGDNNELKLNAERINQMPDVGAPCGSVMEDSLTMHNPHLKPPSLPEKDKTDNNKSLQPLGLMNFAQDGRSIGTIQLNPSDEKSKDTSQELSQGMDEAMRQRNTNYMTVHGQEAGLLWQPKQEPDDECSLDGIQISSVRKAQKLAGLPLPNKYLSPRLKPNYRLQCEKCNYCTKSNVHFKQHVRAHERGRHICKLCNKPYGSFCTLIRHWRSHWNANPSSVVRCDSCHYNTVDMDDLENHMRCHYQAKNPMPATLNPEEFAEMAEKSLSNPIPELHCFQFNKKKNPVTSPGLDNQEYMESEGQEYDPGEFTVKTEFEMPVDLNIEAKSPHPVGSPMKQPKQEPNDDCSLDNIQISSVHGAGDLSGLHLPSKNLSPRSNPDAMFQCDKCKFCTNSELKFTLHVRAHALGRLICKLCFKACLNTSDFTRHWLSHWKDNPASVIRCDSCHYSTVDKDDLENHMQCHYHGNNPLPATLNPGEFAQLAKSLSTHVPEFHSCKSFKCEVCHKVLISKNYYTKHMQMVHKYEYYCKGCSTFIKSFDDHLEHLNICHFDPDPIAEYRSVAFRKKNPVTSPGLEYMESKEQGYNLGEFTVKKEIEMPIDLNIEAISTDPVGSLMRQPKQAPNDGGSLDGIQNSSVQGAGGLSGLPLPNKYLSPRKYPDAIFQCDKCNYCTNSAVHFNQHGLLHERGRCICKLCNKPCGGNPTLIRHWLSHWKANPSTVIRCDSCQYSTDDMDDLEKHMKCHYRLKRIVPATLTRKKFAQMAKSLSNPIPDFRDCGFKKKNPVTSGSPGLVNLEDMEPKMQEYDPGEFTVKKEIEMPIDLDIEAKSPHPVACLMKQPKQEPNDDCSLDGIQNSSVQGASDLFGLPFPNKNLSTRINPDAMFQCNKCNYCTNSDVKFNEHVRAHKLGRLICKLCYKACLHTSAIIKHWLSHWRANPSRVIRCDSCHYSTVNKDKLTKHMKRHYHTKNPLLATLLPEEFAQLAKSLSAPIADFQSFAFKKQTPVTSPGLEYMESEMQEYDPGELPVKTEVVMPIDINIEVKSPHPIGRLSFRSTSGDEIRPGDMTQCDICLKNVYILQLDLHNTLHHKASKAETVRNKTYNCKMCGHICDSETALKAHHLGQHASKGKIRKYKKKKYESCECEICHKVVCDKYYLKIHKRNCHKL